MLPKLYKAVILYFYGHRLMSPSVNAVIPIQREETIFKRCRYKAFSASLPDDYAIFLQLAGLKSAIPAYSRQAQSKIVLDEVF
jgi:hypothetical protein